MENLARWVLEIAIVVGLVAIAVSVQHLLPVPFWLTSVVLVLAILTAHMAFDHYTQQEDL